MFTCFSSINKSYHAFCCNLLLRLEKHSRVLLLVFGLALVTGGVGGLCDAQEEYIKEGANYEEVELNSGMNASLTKLIQGAFGSLVMVVAGLGSFVAAAMGAYKAAGAMLVVAIGAFIARGTISVMSGYDNVKY